MILMRLVVGPLQVNCYIVADENTKEAIVIDPGDDAEEILNVLADKGLTARYIVNTHAHFDHTGANGKLKDSTGAQLLLHEADALLLRSASNQARMFGMDAAPSPNADRFIKQGDVITVGSLSLKVLHPPGHSPGGISLAGDGMVFTGDTLFQGSIGRTDLPGGDLATLLASVKANIMGLPDDTSVYPGHGPDSTVGEEKRENPFLNESSGFI